MTPDAAGIEAALAAGLAAHDWMRGLAACRCGWEDPTPNWCGEDDRHRAHVAAALLPVVTQAQAEALREAADEMEAVIAAGDVAEVAAFVPGEVGRSAAVARRDSLYEEPAEWLRARVDESGA